MAAVAAAVQACSGEKLAVGSKVSIGGTSLCDHPAGAAVMYIHTRTVTTKAMSHLWCAFSVTGRSVACSCLWSSSSRRIRGRRAGLVADTLRTARNLKEAGKVHPAMQQLIS